MVVVTAMVAAEMVVVLVVVAQTEKEERRWGVGRRQLKGRGQGEARRREGKGEERRERGNKEGPGERRSGDPSFALFAWSKGREDEKRGSKGASRWSAPSVPRNRRPKNPDSCLEIGALRRAENVHGASIAERVRRLRQ